MTYGSHHYSTTPYAGGSTYTLSPPPDPASTVAYALIIINDRTNTIEYINTPGSVSILNVTGTVSIVSPL